jgi:hypothetical protein
MFALVDIVTATIHPKLKTVLSENQLASILLQPDMKSVFTLVDLLLISYHFSAPKLQRLI